MVKEDNQSVPVQFESIAAWSQRSGMKVGTIYARLASGDLKAVKVGRRTLIDVEHGLRWLKGNSWTPSGPVA